MDCQIRDGIMDGHNHNIMATTQIALFLSVKKRGWNTGSTGFYVIQSHLIADIKSVS